MHADRIRVHPTLLRHFLNQKVQRTLSTRHNVLPDPIAAENWLILQAKCVAPVPDAL